MIMLTAHARRTLANLAFGLFLLLAVALLVWLVQGSGYTTAAAESDDAESVAVEPKVTPVAPSATTACVDALEAAESTYSALTDELGSLTDLLVQVSSNGTVEELLEAQAALDVAHGRVDAAMEQYNALAAACRSGVGVDVVEVPSDVASEV